MKALAFLALGAQGRSFTDFNALNIDGNEVDFRENYAGRVAIVVNVASQ